MKRIRMKAIYAGPDGAMDKGKTYPVEDAKADALVNAGYAEHVDMAPPKAQAEETATKQPEPERAVKFEARHIGGGWYDYQGQRMRKKDLPEEVRL